MYVKFGESPENNWADYTLVVPCIAVGNVPQLAADVLIYSLSMDKVGGFYDDSLVPVIGNDPFHEGDSSKSCQLMTAAEVFEKRDHKLVVVQLRSAIVKGKCKQFVNKFHEWLSMKGFKQVIVLTSSFSHERIDSQLTGSQQRYVASPDFKKLEAAQHLQEQLNWIPLEKRESHPAFRDKAEMEPSSENDTENDAFKDVFIPGGGFAKRLMQKCSETKIPVVALLHFCAEGDNLPDAIELASYLNSWTKWVKPEDSPQAPGLVRGWKIPPSWRLLFGSGFRQLLF